MRTRFPAALSRKARSVRFQGTTEHHHEALKRIQDAGDYVLVVRGVPRSLVMSCPDGCGEIITLNLDDRGGRTWRLYKKKGRITIYPSVWRDSGCKSHFIVRNNQIMWFGLFEDTNVTLDDVLVKSVKKALPALRYKSYESIAAKLGESPWDVLWACEKLVRKGEAIEGSRGNFRKAL